MRCYTSCCCFPMSCARPLLWKSHRKSGVTVCSLTQSGFIRVKIRYLLTLTETQMIVKPGKSIGSVVETVSLKHLTDRREWEKDRQAHRELGQSLINVSVNYFFTLSTPLFTCLSIIRPLRRPVVRQPANCKYVFTNFQRKSSFLSVFM